MKQFRILYLLTSVSLILSAAQAQPAEKIKIKKDFAQLYFFQRGARSDTILKNENDLFYLLVPDSLKSVLSISIENGRFQSMKNDSLVRLELIKGLNYEGLYTPEETPGIPEKEKRRIFKCLINGTAAEPGNVIRIRFVNRKKNEMLLENTVYYLEKN